MGVINRGLILVIIVLLIILQCFAIDYDLNFLKCGEKVLYTLTLDIPLAFYLLYSLIRMQRLSNGSLSIQWMIYSISIAVKFYYLTYPYESITPLDGFKHLYWATYITKHQGHFALTPLIYLLYHKLCIELSNISVWLHEMLHADLCISTIIDIWDVISVAHSIPNLTQYKNIMFMFVICSIISLGLVLPTTGIQVRCKTSDWRRNSDIFIIVKFTYLVGLFLIDIPFLTYRIYDLSQGNFSILFVKNFLFIFIRSFRLAIWQLAYRDAVKWNEGSKSSDCLIKDAIDFSSQSYEKEPDKIGQLRDSISNVNNIIIGDGTSKTIIDSKKYSIYKSKLTRDFTRTNFHKSTLRRLGFKDKSTLIFERSDSEKKEIDVSGFDLDINMREYLQQFVAMCSKSCVTCCEKYVSDDITLSLLKRIRLVTAFNIQPVAHLAILLIVVLDCYNRTSLLTLTIVLGIMIFLCDFYTAPLLDVLYNTMYAIVALVSAGYSIDTFWKVNRFYIRIFVIIAFSLFPTLVIIPNFMSSLSAITNVPYACHKIIIMSCRWCIAPISHHGIILGGEVIKNVILTDHLLQAHWTGVTLLMVSKIFCIVLSPNWIIYLIHIGLSISYAILSQTVRILQQRKYEIQFLQKPSQPRRSSFSPFDDELGYISRFGLFSCPGHLLPPII